jgi:hypothetical protein
MNQAVHQTGIMTDLNVNTVGIFSYTLSESILNTKGELLVNERWQ